jgi:hypothetical protein
MPNLIKTLLERRVEKEPLGVRISTGEDGLPVIEAHKSSQIKTLEDLLKESDVDLNEWEVEKHTSNVWNNFSSTHGLVHLWQVKAFLRRKDLSKSCLESIISEGLKGLSQGISQTIKKAEKPKGKNGIMVEFAIPDLHLGKHAWGEETGGGNWDLNIAQEAYKEALNDLLTRSPEGEEAWLIVGNDFYNVDNNTNTTTAGTPQDEDGRWGKTFITGVSLIKWAIGRLISKYPKVKVIVVRGNHDSQRAFYLGTVLEEAFAKEKRVDIDNRLLDRKYYQWGNTGLGYAHGDKVKVKDLAHLCQHEAREIWGRTKRFELHLGHLHQDIVKNLGGVVVRWLPALCPPDAWHASQGYTMAEKGATALVYDQRGLNTLIPHYPRAELFY